MHNKLIKETSPLLAIYQSPLYSPLVVRITVLARIFPEGKFGHIVNMKMQQEPDAVANLALRLESLGQKHVLFPLAKELRTRIAASRKAVGAYEASGQQVKQCQAEEEIAKATLRRQYENNYLDARKQFGKMRAERLFPKLKASQRTLAACPTA